MRNNSCDATGGAIHAESGAAVTASDCIFEANVAANGEGVFLRSANSVLTLTRCQLDAHDLTVATNRGMNGGALYLEDGITNVSDCSFSGNQTSGSGGAAYVGIPARLIALDSAFSANESGIGGAISAEGLVTLDCCTFTANRAMADDFNFGSGGALAYGSYVGAATLTECAFTGNVAEGANLSGGGAVHASGAVDLRRCTLDGNSATGPADSGRGGALFVINAPVTLEDCELSGNVADSSAAGIGGVGGAVDLWPGGLAALRRCTVAGNAATSSGGSPAVDGIGGGVNSPGAANATLDHTIVADNLADAVGGAPDLAGTATSGGWNLIGDSTGATLSGGSNDLQDVDPLFVDPLNSDWSVQLASPAVDSGDGALFLTTTDLSGYPRVLDANFDQAMRIDRGAHEFCHVRIDVTGSATPGGTLTITSTGTAGLHGLMLASAAPSALKLKPFGTLFVDLSQPALIEPWFDLPSVVDIDIDPAFPVPFTFFVQQLAYGTRVGNLSNLARIDIE
ncbi:MAG: hypothetical protein EXS13_13925 [Planctomycetes bacterium]|nr:hypothetical protein [Planctomycetota bacterium]